MQGEPSNLTSIDCDRVEGRCSDCKEMASFVDDHHIEVSLWTNGEVVKTFVLPSAQLNIEDIKKKGINTWSGETVLDDITDYHRFIITADEGYTETFKQGFKAYKEDK